MEAETAVVVLPTPDAEPEEREIDSEWLESFLNRIVAALETVTQSQSQQANLLSELGNQIQTISSRVPENLSQSLSEAHQTIARLVSESMETVRALLTPPVQPPIVTEPPAVVVEDLEAAAVVESEPAQPKRRKI